MGIWLNGIRSLSLDQLAPGQWDDADFEPTAKALTLSSKRNDGKVTSKKQPGKTVEERLEALRCDLASVVADPASSEWKPWNVSRDADGNIIGDLDVDYSKVDRKSLSK